MEPNQMHPLQIQPRPHTKKERSQQKDWRWSSPIQSRHGREGRTRKSNKNYPKLAQRGRGKPKASIQGTYTYTRTINPRNRWSMPWRKYFKGQSWHTPGNGQSWGVPSTQWRYNIFTDIFTILKICWRSWIFTKMAKMPNLHSIFDPWEFGEDATSSWNLRLAQNVTSLKV